MVFIWCYININIINFYSAVNKLARITKPPIVHHPLVPEIDKEKFSYNFC